jgi:hypothetical protein
LIRLVKRLYLALHDNSGLGILFFNMKQATFLAILFLLSSLSMNARAKNDSTSSRGRKEWADIGLGSSSTDYFKTVPNDANFAFNYNRSFGKAYYQVGINGNVLTTTPYLSTVNVGIGNRLCSRYYLLSGFIGPAFMWGNKTETGTYFSTIGLSTTVQCILKPLRDLGIGIELYSNLNLIQSNAGLRVVLSISNGK